MTDDLRRLRLHGLIERVPHTHRYRITQVGARVATFYARLYTRALRPACSLQPVGVARASASSIDSTPRSPAFWRRSNLRPEKLDSNSHTCSAQDC
jgi:hypothetical protein